MQVLGIIPARYGSTRFPGKPLVEIGGKPMIQRVYEQAKQCKDLSDVIVATDDEKIEACVLGFGGKVVMTSSSHQSGTDRCNEVLEKMNLPFDVVVNIQGDEPFLNPEQISELIDCFGDEQTQIATLIKKIDNVEAVFDANKVKVVRSENNFALYFSRSPIPCNRDLPKEKWIDNHDYFKHIGVYGYKTQVLKEVSSLPKSKLENVENLEQLRWLEAGYKIKLAETNFEAIAIDTPGDLEKLNDLL